MQVEHYTAPKPTCNNTPAVVQTVTPQADGSKQIRFVVSNGKGGFGQRTITAKQGTPAFGAAVGELWQIQLNSVSGVLCDVPAVRMNSTCDASSSLAVCKFPVRPAKEVPCTNTPAVVQTVTPQADGSKQVRFVVSNGKGGFGQRTITAKQGTPAYNATVGQVWQIQLNSVSGVLCDSPVTLLKQQCDTSYEACKFPLGGNATVGSNGTVAVPGVVIAKESPTTRGGCKFTFVYPKSATEVGTGVFELPTPNAGCTTIALGQAYMVLRDKVTGAFSGAQMPMSLVRDDYCTKPFTPANAEVCKQACAGIQCEPAGCDSVKELTGGIVLSNESVGQGKRRITIAFNTAANKTVRTGAFETDRQAEVRLAPGQACTIRADSKTGAFCGIVRPLTVLSQDFCAPGGNRTTAGQTLCQDTCARYPAACPTSRPPTTPSPGGGGGGGGGGTGNIDINLKSDNTNKNTNRSMGGFGYGPHLYPPGSLYTGASFILPPEKIVVPVPVFGETHVIGAVTPTGDNLMGWGNTWSNGTMPLATAAPTTAPTDAPTAAPEATSAAPERERDYEPDPEPSYVEAEQPKPQKKKINYWWIVCCLCAIALILGGAYWYIRKKKGKGSKKFTLFM